MSRHAMNLGFFLLLVSTSADDLLGPEMTSDPRVLAGDSSASTTNSTNDGTSHDFHPHAHEALLFPFIGIMMGMMITHASSRLPALAALPYTVTLLFLGWILGAIHVESKGSLGTLSNSIRMWMEMDPHLLLYAFLPILLFGDAFSIIWHDFRRTACQCSILAGPGVVIGTGFMFLVSKYVFPYGWTDVECATFASILAATDPVAVVAVLKELGASRVLTMQIAGESLLNDGVAIVVWSVFHQFMLGDDLTAGDIILMFLRLAAGGLLFGFLVSIITARWIALASDKLVHTDDLIQLSLTVTVAYLAFIIGENELKVSGVLAVIFTALKLSQWAGPLIIDPGGIQHVWHLMEYLGNTVLFIFCGIMSYDSWAKVAWSDVGWCLVLYFFATVARGLMIFMLKPFVDLAGGSDITRTSWKECLVMTWGGLRGAVGLALILVVRATLVSQGKQSTADVMVFLVSGFATLTLFVNATTCGVLLNMLELTRPPDARVAMMDGLKTILVQLSHEYYTRSVESDGRFRKVHQDSLKGLLDSLGGDHGVHEITDSGTRTRATQVRDLKVPVATDADNELEKTPYWWSGFENPASRQSVQMMVREDSRKTAVCGSSTEERTAYRKLFLSMLRSRVLELISSGMLPARSEGSEKLLAAIDEADDFAADCLSDWRLLEERLYTKKRESFGRILELLQMVSPYSPYLPMETSDGTAFFDLFAVVNFLDAHHQICTQMLTCETFSADARKTIIAESVKEIESARETLEQHGIGVEDFQKVRTIQLASMLFEQQKIQVMQWSQMGVISSKETEELLHVVLHGIHHSQHSIQHKVLEAATRLKTSYEQPYRAERNSALVLFGKPAEDTLMKDSE